MRKSMEGLRAELEASMRRTLTADEKVYALSADMVQWNKAKSRAHYALPKASEFIHRATWAAGRPNGSDWAKSLRTPSDRSPPSRRPPRYRKNSKCCGKTGKVIPERCDGLSGVQGRSPPTFEDLADARGAMRRQGPRRRRAEQARRASKRARPARRVTATGTTMTLLWAMLFVVAVLVFWSLNLIGDRELADPRGGLVYAWLRPDRRSAACVGPSSRFSGLGSRRRSRRTRRQCVRRQASRRHPAGLPFWRSSAPWSAR